jgi:hypothetical protein
VAALTLRLQYGEDVARQAGVVFYRSGVDRIWLDRLLHDGAWLHLTDWWNVAFIIRFAAHAVRRFARFTPTPTCSWKVRAPPRLVPWRGPANRALDVFDGRSWISAGERGREREREERRDELRPCKHPKRPLRARAGTER